MKDSLHTINWNPIYLLGWNLLLEIGWFPEKDENTRGDKLEEIGSDMLLVASPQFNVLTMIQSV